MLKGIWTKTVPKYCLKLTFWKSVRISDRSSESTESWSSGPFKIILFSSLSVQRNSQYTRKDSLMISVNVGIVIPSSSSPFLPFLLLKLSSAMQLFDVMWHANGLKSCSRTNTIVVKCIYLWWLELGENYNEHTGYWHGLGPGCTLEMVHSLWIFARALEKFGIHLQLDCTDEVLENQIPAAQGLSYIANGEFPRKGKAVQHAPTQNPYANCQWT